jgi:hypothetical protein
MAISRRLYESNVPLDADQWEHLKALGVDVYLLARSPGRALRMERVDHARAFATQTGRFSVFHIVKRSP